MLNRVSGAALAALMSLSAVSCGVVDGLQAEDGKAYLSFTTDTTVTTYDDTNPNPHIGWPLDFSATFESDPGTYDFTYGAACTVNGVWQQYYWGSYTITINEAETGIHPALSEDGEDKYFTLGLNCEGPGFVERAVGAPTQASDTVTKSATSTFNPGTGMTTVEKTQGRYTVHIEYHEGS